MASTRDRSNTPTVDRDAMHELYREGGERRQMAPHVIYSDAVCPHARCDQRMQAIDFGLEDYGRSVHDPLGHGGTIPVSRGSARTAADGFTSRSAANGRSPKMKQGNCRNFRRTGMIERRCSK